MKKVLPQVLGWVVFFFLWAQVVYFYVDNRWNRWLFTGFDIGLVLVSFYLLYSWVTPRFFQRGKRLAFVSGFILSVLATAGLMFWIMTTFLRRQLVPIHFNLTWDYGEMEKNRLFIALLGAGAGFIAQLAGRWVQARRRAAAAEKEKIATELTYLRAQVNPHFLFNSLNTIYVQMSMPGEDARETLSTFSDMLRYQLYECTGERVSLDKEVNYIRNYIRLQRLRKDDRYDIEFAFEGDPADAAVAPFLLMPFVENMFKHVSNHPAGGNIIRGELSLDPGRLRFEGMNTRDGAGGTAGSVAARGAAGGATAGAAAGGATAGAAAGGIGLANVRRRLDLLYPGAHTLTIDQQPNTYSVCLELRLR
jgi:LytS/YehU family sensor histidine kinase